MDLTIWIPSGVWLQSRTSKVVASGLHGSFCLLPRHADAIAGLKPGLFSLETPEGSSLYLALDEGCLLKSRSQVTVVTLQAFASEHLETLAGRVRSMVREQDEGERRIRTALAGLESRIARGLFSLESRL